MADTNRADAGKAKGTAPAKAAPSGRTARAKAKRPPLPRVLAALRGNDQEDDDARPHAGRLRRKRR